MAKELQHSDKVVDPIYGSISIDPELSKLLSIAEIIREKERLERIRSLGLISLIFPSATHTKWEHHMGMYHVSKALNLGTEDSHLMRRLCILGGIGHLPYTFAAETAVLLAASLSEEFRSQLFELLAPVWEMCIKHDTELQQRELLERLVKDYDVSSLHSWFSGLKLMRIPPEIDLGHRESLVCHRINSNSDLYKLYRIISRFDYVQRDLYYTGLAEFSIMPSVAFRSMQYGVKGVTDFENSPEVALLSQLRAYLMNNLYRDPRSSLIENVVYRRLARLLLENRFKIEQLLDWGDEDLRTELEKVEPQFLSKARGMRPQVILRNEFEYYLEFREAERNRLQTERKIVGLDVKNMQRILKYSDEYGYLVLVDTGEFDMIKVTIVGFGDTSQLRPLVGAIHNMEKIDYEGDRSDYGQAILRYILQAEDIDCRQGEVELRLIKAIAGAKKELLKELRNALKIQAKPATTAYVFSEQYPFWILNRISRLELGRLLRRKNERGLRYVVETAIKAAVRSKDIASNICPILARIIRHAIMSKVLGQDEGIEVLIYLAQLSRVEEQSEASWVLPLVKIETSKEKREVDVVRIDLLPENIRLTLFACTKSDSEVKALEDHTKLLKLKNLPAIRRFKDLDVQAKVFGDSSISASFLPVSTLLSE